MTQALDFFFFIGSTYTYLAVSRIEAAAARAGVPVRWRPFSVRTIMREQSNNPFAGKPAKMGYMWRDLERRAGRHSIEFRSIPPYPVDPDELANRVAALASIEGWCPGYTRATYRSWFLEARVPGEIPNVRSVLAELGKDPDAVIAKANGQEVRDRYAAQTDAARSLGIFGSPTFAWGSEIFWGDDRLEDALDWAKAHDS
jgi:2-hydroxychromene-2-carboxylate isomerase